MKKRILLSVSGILIIVASLSFNWRKETASIPKAEIVEAVHDVNGAEAPDSLITSYDELNLRSTGLDFEVFQRALTGYLFLKNSDSTALRKSVIWVVDFSKPSTQKRFWVIDLEEKKLIYSTWVAHGQGSGQTIATTFSNQPNSYQSSLGFYKTAEIYYGKHGRSLKLDGLDKGFNDNARERSIVIHGADYVSKDFIRKTGRLGRSQGCPALPLEVSQEIIDKIEGNSLLFIYGDSNSYSSTLLGGIS